LDQRTFHGAKWRLAASAKGYRTAGSDDAAAGGVATDDLGRTLDTIDRPCHMTHQSRWGPGDSAMGNPARRYANARFFGSSIALLGALATFAARAAAPDPVGDTVRLSENHGAGETTITWGGIPDADYYNTYFGEVPPAGMGSRGAQGFEMVTRSGTGGQLVPCPGSKKVIGGGASGSLALWASRPEPPGTGWYASAGGAFVIAYAICADVDATYEIVSLSGGGVQFAACPGSKKVLGGGADGTSQLYSSRPESLGTGWYGSAGGPFVFNYAICATVDSSYEVVSASGGGGQQAPCTGTKIVVGGGAESASRFYNSRPDSPTFGWYADAGGNFIAAYAVCLAGPYGHVCHEAGDALGDGATTSRTSLKPPPGTGLFVLVSAGNSSGEGSLGAGVARDGTPISRSPSSPCPTPP